MSKQTIEVEKGSGNVFKDSGVPNPNEKFMKVRFASIIRDIIVERGLKPNEAAELLNISKSEASTLLEGKFPDFSLDTLLSLLGRLNLYIEFVAHEIPAGAPSKGLRISSSF